MSKNPGCEDGADRGFRGRISGKIYKGFRMHSYSILRYADVYCDYRNESRTHRQVSSRSRNCRQVQKAGQQQVGHKSAGHGILILK